MVHFVPRDFNVTPIDFTSKQNHLSCNFRFPAIILKMALSKERFFKIPYGTFKGKIQATVDTFETLKDSDLEAGRLQWQKIILI